MELQLHAFTNLKFVESHDPPIPDAASCKLIDHAACIFAYKDMRDGCYELTDSTRERLYDFDFAWWADTLSRFALQVPFSEVAGKAQDFQGKPFSELLGFPQDKGAMGQAICAKLAQDFATHKEAALQMSKDLSLQKAHMGKYWFGDYTALEKVFRLGSQNGIVLLEFLKTTTDDEDEDSDEVEDSEFTREEIKAWRCKCGAGPEAIVWSETEYIVRKWAGECFESVKSEINDITFECENCGEAVPRPADDVIDEAVNG